MNEALDPSTSAWEQIHGIHHVPKSYVPPFMKDEMGQVMQSTDSNAKMKDKMYDLEVEALAEGADVNESIIKVTPQEPHQDTKPTIDLEQEQNLEDVPAYESGKRQIKDMKFIRVKVKTLRVEAEADRKSVV